MATFSKLDKIIVTQDATADDQESTICRQNPYPLDTTEVFYDLNTAKNYASNGVTGNKFQNSATCYVGQKITVVDKTNGNATVYVVKNLNGDLVEFINNDNVKTSIVNSIVSMTPEQKQSIKNALGV